MEENKNLNIVKENFFTKILLKIKNFFRKETIIVKDKDKKEEIPSYYEQDKEFIEKIKVTVNSDIFSLKMKLEKNEIEAINLTDDQISELQKIYDQQILKKQNKIKQLKGIS